MVMNINRLRGRDTEGIKKELFLGSTIIHFHGLGFNSGKFTSLMQIYLQA